LCSDDRSRRVLRRRHGFHCRFTQMHNFSDPFLVGCIAPGACGTIRPSVATRRPRIGAAASLKPTRRLYPMFVHRPTGVSAGHGPMRAGGPERTPSSAWRRPDPRGNGVSRRDRSYISERYRARHPQPHHLTAAGDCGGGRGASCCASRRGTSRSANRWHPAIPRASE
jgi:hypothetical protein